MATRAAKGTARPAVRPAQERNEAASISPIPTAGHPVSAQEIRLRAYLKWEAAGKPSGDGLQFWLEAERELHAVK
jgi:hypothetical protein